MASPRLLSHFNTLWPVLIVSELIKNGIDTFFVSPGNRNVPIMAALGAFGDAVVRSCSDERASAYRALGHAKAAGRPGVLVCTSGTAAANYYPAVIEAFRDEIPVIVWSADRPPELVGADANQTIEQEGLFGRFAVKCLNLPCPSAEYPLHALMAGICDLAAVKNGPVHMNLPFREPLLPVFDLAPPEESNTPDFHRAAKDILENPHPHTTRLDAGVHAPVSLRQAVPGIGRLKTILAASERGFAAVGRLAFNEDKKRIEGFLRQTGWPVFCDIASGLKGRPAGVFQVPFLDHPEAAALISAYNPDVILQFGTSLVSKAYYESVSGSHFSMDTPAPATLIQVSPKKGLRDPSHRVDFKMPVAAQDAISFFETAEIGKPPADAVAQLTTGFEALVREMDRVTPGGELTHPVIAKTIFSLMPENEALFAGNSLVIRAFDMLLPEASARVDILSNRGVSGIEGNLATAAGYAETAEKRVTAVVGDISLLHDLNSLLLVARSAVPVVVILINNRGGRIFERLSVSVFDGIPGEWVTTPHDYRFEKAAEQFGLPYRQVATVDELVRAYTAILEKEASGLVEICMSPEVDLKVFEARKAVGKTP